jgi:hypothetical protein
VLPEIFTTLKSIKEEDAALQLEKPCFSAISSFHRETGESYRFLGYYAASNGNYLRTFRDNLSIPFSMLRGQEGTDRLSRTVGRALPPLLA